MTAKSILPTLFSDSAYCWAKDLAPGRNQFVSFVQTFNWQSGEAADLHLFADTRFRLFVNETFVAYGPARFVTQFAEYDSYDLTPFLKEGENLVRVEVNYYGTSSYQSMPDGLPGFIAAGSVAEGKVSFHTPGNWQAKVHQAWDAAAPLFSFAQNPAEICDTRQLAVELEDSASVEVVPLPAESTPWTVLRERAVPYPDYAALVPKQLLVASKGGNEGRCIIGLNAVYADFYKTHRLDGRENKMHQIAAWVHSETDQTVTFESFWSEVEINGEAVPVNTTKKYGNYGTFEAPLKAGWNFYSANFAILTEYWSHMLAWPAAAQLKVQALPGDDRAPWALSPMRDDREIFAFSEASQEKLPEGWTLDSGDISRVTPARLTAWDVPAESAVDQPIPYTELAEWNVFEADSAIWSFDFQDQYYGQLEVEVEAPKGAILDVAYDDWKRADGCVNLYNSNPFTDAVDRFVLKGGRQVVRGVNPRGGIFLQCVLRAPAGEKTAELKIYSVKIRSRQILREPEARGTLKSGNQVMDWIWDVSLHTLQASTDEAYADCPWRERGSYIGDSLVNFHLHRLINPDLSIARRTFRMMAEGQHLDGDRKGQLASVTPAWHRKGHDDFTLIWILCVLDYWTHTGDAGLLEEVWHHIPQIWESPVWNAGENGLWDVDASMHPFIDWGIQNEDRFGKSNLIMNLFRVGALEASAAIADVLGKASEQKAYAEEASTVRSTIEKVLWDDERKRFRCSLERESNCLQGQVLALRFEVGDSEMLLASIEDELRGNFRQGIDEGQNSGHIELYFFMYLLPALGRMGKTELAESFIEEHFSYLKSLNYPTLNECFCRAARGAGSCCHSWSGAPAVYAADYLLGLRVEPGNPDSYLLDPRSHGYDQVSGSIPHAKGVITISWEKKDGWIEAEVTAPKGVEIRCGENVRIPTASV